MSADIWRFIVLRPCYSGKMREIVTSHHPFLMEDTSPIVRDATKSFVELDDNSRKDGVTNR